MERQPIIEPFNFSTEAQNSVIAGINAERAKMPFLVVLGKDGRKGLLRVEKGKATKQKGVYKILKENSMVNKSETLSIDRFSNQLNDLDGLYAVEKQLTQFLDAVKDTILAKSHEVAHQSLLGQEQIRRAANDKAEHEYLLAELKNIKPKKEPTQVQLDKMAAKKGLVKPPTL